jgi:hypothetical protein
MISSIRRIATVVAAVAVVAGTGAGIASATPSATVPLHTGWELSCLFGQNFDWHYYNYCDRHYWHGSHHSDWDDHHNHNWDYNYDWFRDR